MAKIGIVSPSADGHLNPSLTLAAALAERGHEVVFFCLSDGVGKVQSRGFAVRTYAEDEFSTARIIESYRQIGRLRGMAAVRFTVAQIKRLAEIGLEELPELLRAERLDGLVIDQIIADAAVVARAENIPFATVCNALPLNADRAVPPVFSAGLPGRGPWPWMRNSVLNAFTQRFAKPILSLVNRFQTGRGLPSYSDPAAIPSELAQITQVPSFFDFPRTELPDHFHHTAPFHSLASRAPIDFPWNRIDDQRPLIYASMGTLQNQIRSVFEAIAQACRGLPVQLVVSLGVETDSQQLPELPGGPIVVGYAPQLQLLQRAALCITHAGLNTALESLAHGVPMLAIPVTNDQPGVAARIAWTQAGRMIAPWRVTPGRLRKLIELLLSDPTYRQHTQVMRQKLTMINGPQKAASIIEQAIKTGKPVQRHE